MTARARGPTPDVSVARHHRGDSCVSLRSSHSALTPGNRPTAVIPGILKETQAGMNICYCSFVPIVPVKLWSLSSHLGFSEDCLPLTGSFDSEKSADGVPSTGDSSHWTA